MDAVGVIPHQHEVGGGGLQGRQTADGLGRVHHALGVGVLGHVPHTLDGGILHQLLHHVHIGASGGHGNSNHLHAEGLGDLEVPVIAGGGAEPLHLVQLAPWLLAVEQAVGKGLGHRVIHQLQTGVAAHEHLLQLAAQNVGKQRLGGGDTGHLAIVSGLDTVGDKILRLDENAEDIRHQIQLVTARLAPCHIQLQAQRLLLLIGRLDGSIFRLTLLQRHFRVLFHGIASLYACYRTIFA